MERIAKSVYVGECAGSCSVGRPHKRWIDNVKVWISGKQGKWSRVGMNGGGL